MNIQIPLVVVLLVLGGVGILYLLWRFVRALENSARRIEAAGQDLQSALNDFSAALHELREALAPAAGELQTHMAAVPKLLETVARVGQAQLEILQAQRAPQNPFGKTNAPVPPRDVAAANLEDRIQEVMRAEGVTREEAQMRMNPANYESVWGGGVFEGWGGR